MPKELEGVIYYTEAERDSAIQAAVTERLKGPTLRLGQLQTELEAVQGRLATLEPLSQEATQLRAEIASLKAGQAHHEILERQGVHDPAIRRSILTLYEAAPLPEGQTARPALDAWIGEQGAGRQDPAIRALLGATLAQPQQAPAQQAGAPRSTGANAGAAPPAPAGAQDPQSRVNALLASAEYQAADRAGRRQMMTALQADLSRRG